MEYGCTLWLCVRSLLFACDKFCLLIVGLSHFGQVYDAPEGRSILIMYEWDATEHEIYNFCCAFSRSMMWPVDCWCELFDLCHVLCIEDDLHLQEVVYCTVLCAVRWNWTKRSWTALSSAAKAAEMRQLTNKKLEFPQKACFELLVL